MNGKWQCDFLWKVQVMSKILQGQDMWNVDI